MAVHGYAGDFIMVGLLVLLGSAARIYAVNHIPEHQVSITAAPLGARDDSIEDRTDFFAWTRGSDNTYTPTYCYGWPSTSGNLVDCCSDPDYCEFAISCEDNSILRTVYDASGTRSRTLTNECQDPGGLGRNCVAAPIYRDLGDTSREPMTRFTCMANTFIFPSATLPTFFLTLTDDASVWTVVPTYSLAVATSSSTPRETSTASFNTDTTDSLSDDADNASRGDDNTPTSTSHGTNIRTSSTIRLGNTPGSESASNSSSSSTEGSSNKTIGIGVGLGVGLGLPLLIVIGLAWFRPQFYHYLRHGGPRKVAQPMESATMQSTGTTPPLGWDKPEMATNSNRHELYHHPPEIQGTARAEME